MSRDFVSELVSQYASRGALIDTNLLLMYFIGLYDVQAMLNFKRTSAYTEQDVPLMKKLMSFFKKIVTTPNVLTEVSNLAGQLGDPLRTQFFSSLKGNVEMLEEEYCPSANASAHPYFATCGLTDSAVMEIARKRYLVITDDFRLAGLMSKQGMDVLNFNRVRTAFLLKR